MAIQSAINNMLGTAGTVAAISEHIGKQKEANELSVEARKSQDIKDEISMIEKGQEIEKEKEQTVLRIDELAKEGIEATKAGADLEKQMTGIYSTVADKRLRTSKGLFMSNKALQEMKDKQTEIQNQKDAVNGQFEMLKKQAELLDRKRNLYSDLEANFYKNKGGNK